MFLHSPSEMSPVPPAPSEMVLGYSAPAVDVVLYFSCRNFLSVVLNIASIFLSWSIPLSSISVLNFPLSAAVSCCTVCTKNLQVSLLEL